MGFMAILPPRIHVVGIRFSAQEYVDMQEFCVKKQLQSISDLARQAIKALISQTNRKDALVAAMSERTEYVRTLEEKLENLSVEVALLRSRQTARANDESTKERV
jgi:hypothetical protein